MTNNEYLKLPYGTKAYHVVYNEPDTRFRIISNIYKSKDSAIALYDNVDKPELYERIRGKNDAGVRIWI
jgi:hypothetical protein